MKEHTIIVGLVLGFFIIPFLPWQVLILTDLFLVRFMLLACFLASTTVSPIVGILSLAVIGLLFIERNKTKMNYIKKLMQQSTPESPAIQSIVTPDTAPEQPPFDTPVETSVSFFPKEDSGDNSFFPVAPTLNTKQPLPTESANGSRFAIEQSFGWVNPTLAQDDKV